MKKQTLVEYDLEVISRENIAEGIITLNLRRPDGSPLPEWTAGSHIDIVLDENRVRQYSLIELNHDPTTWQIGVLREEKGRGGSRQIHDTVLPGMKIRTHGPRNHFNLLPAQRYIFIAGGIGITPITAMIAEAERLGTPWQLSYGGRTRTSMAFASELLERYGDRVTLVPEDESGFIDLKTLLSEPTEGTLIYCCGPAPLLNAVQRASEHWPEDALHFERFVAVEQDVTKSNEQFEVELADSGMVINVPADKSILQALDEAGVDVLSSCTEGTCGTCVTMVVSGEVDHRDSVLTQKERDANNAMMICVSRAACPRLVLDL